MKTDCIIGGIGGVGGCGETNFVVVVYQDPGGGYWAEVPALPGCYLQGETVGELMANVHEAIGGVLAVIQDRGQQLESNIQVLNIAV